MTVKSMLHILCTSEVFPLRFRASPFPLTRTISRLKYGRSYSSTRQGLCSHRAKSHEVFPRGNNPSIIAVLHFILLVLDRLLMSYLR